jgi:hypothetical protein
MVTLDTKVGDGAERLYQRLGFSSAGILPDYALGADSSALHGTRLVYQYL